MKDNRSAIVLQCLQAKADWDDGGQWRHVYLDNARPVGMNNKSFRSCLAQLSKDGQYKVVDGYAWGKVKMF